MRPEKARLERVAAAVDDVGDGQARGVGRDHGVGPGDALEALHERLLDVEPLDDDLDDPVGLGDAFEVFVEVAERHPVGHAGEHERVGLELLRGRERALDEPVGRAVLADCGRGHVEQVHAQARVGEMRGDLAAHHARAEHGGGAERALRVRGSVGGRGSGSGEGFHERCGLRWVSRAGLVSQWSMASGSTAEKCVRGVSRTLSATGHCPSPEATNWPLERHGRYTKAPIPVTSRPTMSELISLVPS